MASQLEQVKMRVSDLMSEDVIAVRPEETLMTVRDLMLEHDIRHMPVVDAEHSLIGLISQRDLLRNSLIEQADTPDFIADSVLQNLKAEELMTTGVLNISPGMDLREAAQIMLENKIGCLPVVEGDGLVGILTEADFVRLMAGGD